MRIAKHHAIRRLEVSEGAQGSLNDFIQKSIKAAESLKFDTKAKFLEMNFESTSKTPLKFSLLLTYVR